jgi:hypothetical protein
MLRFKYGIETSSIPFHNSRFAKTAGSFFGKPCSTCMLLPLPGACTGADTGTGGAEEASRNLKGQ